MIAKLSFSGHQDDVSFRMSGGIALYVLQFVHNFYYLTEFYTDTNYVFTLHQNVAYVLLTPLASGSELILHHCFRVDKLQVLPSSCFSA
jgi:hypothetical protein